MGHPGLARTALCWLATAAVAIGPAPVSAQPEVPVVAATDYMRAVPDQVRQWVPARYATLGTDGTTPKAFTGPWDSPGFGQLLRNGIAWSLGRP